MPPPFNPRVHVTVRAARHDLIRVKVGSWFLAHSDEADRLIFLRALNPSTDTIALPIGEVAVPRVIFQQTDGSRGVIGNQKLRIRSQKTSGIRPAERPLIAGMLAFRAARVPENGSGFRYETALNLHLDLNPTRFVRHQGYIREIGREVTAWDFGPPRLKTSVTRLGARLEVSLDENDNVLVSPRMERNGNPDAWPRHVRRYWESVTQTFSQLFEDASSLAGTSLRLIEYLSVHSVETYWEFRTNDPCGLVRQLEAHLISLGSSHHTGHFTNGQVVNSASIRVKLRTGVVLKVYAKTDARIRFEICEDLRESSPSCGYSSETLDAFHPMLESCTERATRWMNEVLDHLALYVGNQEGRLPVYVLIHRLVRVIDNPQDAETILGILVSYGGRIALEANSPLRPAVQRLVEAGVLLRVRRYGQCFRVIPPFVMAIAQLRGQSRMRFDLPSD